MEIGGIENLNKPMLTINQDINKSNISLKTKSELILCPYCKNQDFSNMDKKLNKLNIIFCIFTLGIFWAPHQLLRNKDCNCYDTKHTCKKCGQEIFEYKAC